MHARSRQNGAALIVSLIMLLLLTVVGISSVRMTSLQEGMAGNLQFSTKTFEWTEEAVRFGEAEAQAFGDGANANNTEGLFDSAGFDNDPNSDDEPRWRDSGTSWRGDPEIDGEYILEQIDEVPRDPSCKLNASTTCYTMLYRVTARAEMDNTGADAMIQTTYKAP